jgi:hypothetical protein
LRIVVLTLMKTDFKDWHKPKWFRLDVYPFTTVLYSELEISTQATITASIIGMALALPLFFLFTSFSTPPPSDWLYWLLSYAPCRLFYALFQEAFLCIWLNKWIQQRWAATFYDSKTARKLLSAPSPTFAFVMWTWAPMYCICGILLGSAWLKPSHRMNSIWFATILLFEPLISYGISKFKIMEQRLQAEGYESPFPLLPWNVALVICLNVPLIFLLYAGEQEVLASRLICVIRILYALVLALWFMGVPGVLYYLYLYSQRYREHIIPA